jgi:hypothetical protein
MESLLLSCGALLVIASLDQLSFYLGHLICAHFGAWRRVIQVRVLRGGQRLVCDQAKSDKSELAPHLQASRPQP